MVSWGKLQTSQNAYLRVAIGCHLISIQAHIHEETNVIPVRQHNTYNLRNHPSHAILNDTPSLRSIKKGLNENTYRKRLKERRTEVRIARYPMNMVRNSRPNHPYDPNHLFDLKSNRSGQRLKKVAIFVDLNVSEADD